MATKRTKPLTDQVRRAIKDSGVSRYRIAQESGVSQSTLAQFCNGNRGLSMEALNALGQFLQLEITMNREPDTKGK
jgi:transcriptional regulator with XRE-family HTH domain